VLHDDERKKVPIDHGCLEQVHLVVRERRLDSKQLRDNDVVQDCVAEKLESLVRTLPRINDIRTVSDCFDKQRLLPEGVSKKCLQGFQDRRKRHIGLKPEESLATALDISPIALAQERRHACDSLGNSSVYK